MKIVKPNHEIMLPESPLKHIEKIGRICYKSEDAITETSAGPFVGRLFKSGHHAMLEHFRFIIKVNRWNHYYPLATIMKGNKYITFTERNGRCIVSMSARGINDMYTLLSNSTDVDDIIAVKVLKDMANLIMEHYGCIVMFHKDLYMGYDPSKEHNDMAIIDNFNELSDYEYQKHAWYSILFTCDRGVTHEMVRHRDASFAQESTRYCNYSKGKYGEITTIDPFFFDKDEERRMVTGCDFPVNKYDVWATCMKNLEKAYMMLSELGAVPQQARTILPSSTKADIVITAQVYEWNHIFDLRVLGKTGAPHPQIKEVMEPAYNEMLAKHYLR